MLNAYRKFESVLYEFTKCAENKVWCSRAAAKLIKDKISQLDKKDYIKLQYEGVNIHVLILAHRPEGNFAFVFYDQSKDEKLDCTELSEFLLYSDEVDNLKLIEAQIRAVVGLEECLN